MYLYRQSIKPQGIVRYFILNGRNHMNIRRIIIASIMATVSFVAAAQTDAHKAAAEAAKTLTEAPKTEEKVKKPTHWKSSLKTNINFGQTSLTNWAAGGDNTVSLAAYVDANANYAKDQQYWNNRLQLDYGFLYASSKPILQKNTDRIYLESKWGLKIPKAKNLSFTVKYDFKSQFTTGYNYLTPKITEEDYENAAEEMRKASEKEVFFAENMRVFETLEEMINYDGIVYSVNRYDNPDIKLRSLTNDYEERKWGKIWGTVISEITPVDRLMLKKELENQKKKFKKRLETYWKRYGASKLKTWTYLVD